jgi:rhodanese-related sulfurtransferase
VSYRSITARELKARLDSGERPELLDVREPWELALSRLPGATPIPLGELSGRFGELDPERPTVAVCHHGVRSAHVTRALQEAGFRDVVNLEGGLDAYSEVDGDVPRY